MAQVIELSGESNPLTPHNVLNSLLQASGSSQQQVQTGTKQLQNWEKQEKYYTYLQVHSRLSAFPTLWFLNLKLLRDANCLQDIFLDHSVPLEARYLAIIQLKNGIDKYWRKTAPKYAYLFCLLEGGIEKALLIIWKALSRKKRKTRSSLGLYRLALSNQPLFLPFIMP